MWKWQIIHPISRVLDRSEPQARGRAAQIAQAARGVPARIRGCHERPQKEAPGSFSITYWKIFQRYEIIRTEQVIEHFKGDCILQLSSSQIVCTFLRYSIQDFIIVHHQREYSNAIRDLRLYDCFEHRSSIDVLSNALMAERDRWELGKCREKNRCVMHRSTMALPFAWLWALDAIDTIGKAIREVCDEIGTNVRKNNWAGTNFIFQWQKIKN